MRAPEFWTSKTRRARALAALLSPLGGFYAARTHRAARRARPFRPQASVICVGNLTAGGAGKTPVALRLGEMLQQRGRTVFFLTRGYGGRLSGPIRVEPSLHGAAEVGDEALLLAACAPTILARDRAEGAVMADRLGAEIVIMDDGFQNFALTKDLSLLVIDGRTGFGNGRVIPAGPLRESVRDGLARADAVIVMGDGKPDLHRFDGPVLHAHIAPAAPESLRGREVMAFAGIGRPEKFFASLEQMGAVVKTTKGYADHHIYRARELQRLRDAAKRRDVLLVTTEKDYARIPAVERQDIVPVPVQVRFAEEAAAEALLDSLAFKRELSQA
jgi:tetraacyldisaccharide 4'-kinase